MLLGVIGFILGGLVSSSIFLFRRKQRQIQIELERSTAARIIEEAKKEASAIRREGEIQAKDSILKSRVEFEKEVRETRREVQELERKLFRAEESLDKRMDKVEKRGAELEKLDASVRGREKALEGKEAECKRLIDDARSQLEQVAGMSREEARRNLIEQMVEEARYQSAKRIRLVEEQAKEEADQKAKKIVTLAIERLAGDFVTERTVSVVHLPNDDMKGRIIGREGRNIRALEAATGIDLIVDDTPESVILSGHNPIRREIARMSLEKLISDGRIHPGRIEEVVRKAEQEVEESIREAGQKAIFDVGVHGIHPEIIKLLGRLKFRYSYAQNVLLHSIEAAFICGAMAAELGLNERQARRAALLHDIGKAVDHEVEGSHAIIGAELARKYGESPKIVNAIAAHHEEVKAETILAPLVDAADALSGARPGARREMVETYVRRLEELERISNSFKGVEKSYAVQAGREIRIIVQSNVVSDEEAARMAREVALKIESEMTYPGQVKVTVIREVRAVDYAR
ncbi:MAG: ribonuclease Y [Deltaproteobacteria bacterium]|nr:ribonuclease Y [Deltaproteobacteria bacterium]MCZ6547943.1 ribonuclease Y [Deltaproteobacteria bacterium]MCZ6562957.1 ribonuclease Y [Deltaproteobacteria bacterium]MCZ6905865.1 ribonuclease Y [Deltaproteobacteria bacterium]